MSEQLEQLIQEAHELFDAHRWDDAMAKYEEALKIDPTSRRALNRIAHIHAVRGRIQEIVKTCFRWQVVLEDLSRFALAAEVSNAILRFDPHSVEARTALLRHLEIQGEEEEYLNLARREARFFMEVGQGEISIEVLTRALELFPDMVDLALDLADMCVAQGHLQEAVQQFRRLASQFEARGELERASDAYRRLKLLLPDAPDVSMRLGHTFMEQGRFEDAITEFRSVLRTNLTHRDALMGLGEASLRKGAHRDAILALRKILAVDSRDMDAHRILGEAYESQGMTDEAIKEFLAVGMILAEFEEYSEAQEAFRKVLALDAEHPTAVRELSNAAAAQERKAARAARAASPPPAPGPADQGAALAPPPPQAASVSEDELYAAGPGPAEDEVILGGAPEAEVILGPPTEPAPRVSDNGVARPALKAVPAGAPGNGVHVPTPMLFLERMYLLELIREQIQEAPDPDVLPWSPLPDLDPDAVAGREGVEIEDAEVEGTTSAGPGAGGRVRSAFGITDGFSQAFASGAATRGRRGSFEFLPSGRGPRTQAPKPVEPEPPLSMAERIARARQSSEGPAE